MGAGNDRKFWGLWYFQDLPPKRPSWVNFPMPSVLAGFLFVFVCLLPSSLPPDRILEHIHLMGRPLQEAFPDLPQAPDQGVSPAICSEPSPAATMLPCSSFHTHHPSNLGSWRVGAASFTCESPERPIHRGVPDKPWWGRTFVYFVPINKYL